MKLIYRVLTIVTIMAAMLTFGCGPDKQAQYNQLKKETIELTKVEKYHKFSTPMQTAEQVVKGRTDYLSELDKRYPKVKENMKKMEELSKDSVQMTNDFLKTKKEYFDLYLNKREYQIKEINEAKKAIERNKAKGK